MLEETETEETKGLFCHIFDIGYISIGGRTPPGHAYVLGSFVLKMRKLFATSEAEFNFLVGASMGSKPSGTKAAVILPFGNKFKFEREGARRLR